MQLFCCLVSVNQASDSTRLKNKQGAPATQRMHPHQIQFALQRKKHITFNNLVFSLKKIQINVHSKFEDKNTLLPDVLDQFYFTQGNTLSYHCIQIRVNRMRWNGELFILFIISTGIQYFKLDKSFQCVFVFIICKTVP